MNNSKTIQLEIRNDFKELQSKEDLLCLLNKVKPLVYGDNAYPFKINQLSWYYNTNIPGTRYHEFTINKKSGKTRNIHAPVEGLKAIQKTLAYILDCLFEPHESSFGFRKGKSIVENANKHIGSRYVYNIDLKDFFPSIDQARIWKCLQLKPFERSSQIKIKTKEDYDIIIKNKFNDNGVLDLLSSLVIKIKYSGLNLTNGFWDCKNFNGSKLSYKVSVNNIKRDSGTINIIRSLEVQSLIDNKDSITKEYIHSMLDAIIDDQKNIIEKLSPLTIVNIIAALSCTNITVERKSSTGEWYEIKKNVLPQGAPTSPIITNIICKRLDILLTGLSKRFGLKYSRYADDITFSSEHNVYQKNSEFNKELNRIIENQGFNIKPSKTRLQTKAYRQEVTGLLVNSKVNIQKRYIKQLRTWIYLLEKHSYFEASNIFLKHYLNDRGNVKNSKVKIENVIRGKLEYLKMIKGANNALYIKLRNRLNNATNKTVNLSSEILDLIKFEDFKNDQTINKNNLLNLNEVANTNNEDSIVNNNILDKIFEMGLDKAMDEYDA